LQWLHDTGQISAVNMNTVKDETNRHFGKKKNKRESLKGILISLKQTTRTGILEICKET
jgi:hypothetical protein